jgi:hypothetical protein
MENVNSSHGGIPLGKLVFGIVLLAVGILSFTDYLDITDLHRIWRFWPVLLIVGGLSSEIDSLRQRKGGGGYILVAVGVWFLAGNQHFFGLTQRTAFPLGVAVAGLGLIVHSLVVPDAKRIARKEDRDGHE